ncbi:unnamed protein product, partial [Prorocentrum cordatum]
PRRPRAPRPHRARALARAAGRRWPAARATAQGTGAGARLPAAAAARGGALRGGCPRAAADLW